MVNVILLVIGLITIVNLFVTLYEPSHIMHLVDNNATTSLTEKWAIRGQIGDILAGHGSVIAFLLLIYSIRQQAESLINLRDSLNLQKKSLTNQNDALELSITEYKNQVIEFQVMNTQSKVYKLIDRLENTMDSLEYKIYEINTKEEEIKVGISELNNDTSAFTLHNVNRKYKQFSIYIQYEQISRLFDRYLLLKKIISDLDIENYEHLRSEFMIIKNQMETQELQQLIVLIFLTYKLNVLIGHDYIDFLSTFKSNIAIENNIAQYLLEVLKSLKYLGTIDNPEKKLHDEIDLFIASEYNFNAYLLDEYKVMKNIFTLNMNLLHVN